MKPTIGRIVHYKLTEQDAASINVRRSDFGAHTRLNPRTDPGRDGATGHIAHVGNRADAGQVYPATIVRVFEPGPVNGADEPVNLQVHLDGNDTFWATSRHVGTRDGDYAWPERVA